MTPPLPPHLADARCWTCGYQLRGVESHRCPECGRAFDPANPKSMNFAGTIGRVGRLLLRMPGWPTFALMLVATGLVMWGTGMPRELNFRSEDRLMLGEWLEAPKQWRSWSPRWNAYALGLVVAATATAWLLLRLMLRGLTVALRRPPANLRQTRYRPLAATALLAMAIFAFVALGGSARIINEWVYGELAPARRPGGRWLGPAWMNISRERRWEIVGLMLTAKDPVTRRVGLRAVVAEFPHWLRDTIARHAPLEKDGELLATHLQLLALHRDPESTSFVERFLDDPRPAVRAATADALGIILSPSYPLDRDGDGFRPAASFIVGRPPIDVSSLVTRRSAIGSRPELPLEDGPRQKLTNMMLASPTVAEREAAARALLPHPPPGYRLRLAEWGVWIDENGDLVAAKAVEEEVPRFVHRTGNPIAEFNGRARQSMLIVLKPIIHLTSSVPLAVDVEVRFHHGRPWFAYPMPDDFEVSINGPLVGLRRGGGRVTAQPLTVLAPLDNAALGTLPAAELRSGYPWLGPHHRTFDPNSSSFANRDRFEVGIHWQSAIVSPAKLPWMAEPDVGPDPKHQWWKHLRSVECSWVSSRGESERFLYYDGPTLLKMDTKLSLAGSVLTVAEVDSTPENPTLAGIRREPGRGVRVTNPPAPEAPRVALFVSVAADGRITGVPFDASPGTHDFAKLNYARATLAGDRVEAWLLNELRRRRLGDGESAGLIDCWRDAFFKNPGRRVLTLLSREDYDAFCPLDIRPAPTESARVGIVLTEFSQ